MYASAAAAAIQGKCYVEKVNWSYIIRYVKMNHIARTKTAIDYSADSLLICYVCIIFAFVLS